MNDLRTKPLLAGLAVLILSACASAPQRLAEPAENPYDWRGMPGAVGPVGSAELLLPSFDELLPVTPVADGGSRFDVAAAGVPVHQFFQGLVEISGTNIVLPPDLEGSISLGLSQVVLEDVLAAIRDSYGYDYEKTPYGYRVRPDALETRVFQVDYLHVSRDGVSRSRVNATGIGDRDSRRERDDRPERGYDQDREGSEGGVRIETRSESRVWEELLAGVEQILGEAVGRSASVSPQAGVIVVTAARSELEMVGRYLDALEVNVNRQVTLEAKIIEVTLDEGFQSGINWSSLSNIGSHGSIGINQVGGGTLLSGSGATAGNSGSLNPAAPMLPNLSAANAFGGAFSMAVNLRDFVGFIELLETQGDVKVLSSPRVSTLNNQKAVIKVGTDQFFVTDISTTTTSAGNALQTTPSVELTPFFSGIALDVTPQISSANEVTLHVHPTISEVREVNKALPIGEQSRDVPLAVSTVRESDSIVRARSGQVIVIGGLMQQQDENQNAGVPGLKSVPLLGRLFQQERRSTRKKELVILLRPVVGDAAVNGPLTPQLAGR